MFTVCLLVKSRISGSTPGAPAAANAAGAAAATAAATDAAGRAALGDSAGRAAAAEATGDGCCCYFFVTNKRRRKHVHMNTCLGMGWREECCGIVGRMGVGG